MVELIDYLHYTQLNHSIRRKNYSFQNTPYLFIGGITFLPPINLKENKYERTHQDRQSTSERIPIY